MTYELWLQCRVLALQEGLSGRATARRLGASTRTVARALAMQRYEPPQRAPRGSILDPWKGLITGKIQQFPELNAVRLHQMVAEDGFPGSYNLVKQYVAELRPRLKPAYRTLTFLPGECAQVDWGCWRSVQVEGTRRRLSFFVMVLGHSRMMYAELSFSQSMEHWLSCHRNALEYFGAVPEKVMVDNCRTAVQKHPRGGDAVFNNHYLDFAAWYGFTPVACAVRRANEKGQVENAVGYLKKSFFPGRCLDRFEPLQSALRNWLDTVANVRVHGTTGKRPIDLFKNEESAALRPLPELPYQCAVNCEVRADSRFRVTLDTNRYSVPAEYASCSLHMNRLPERIELLYKGKVIASHVRSYARRQDLADSAHDVQLLTVRRHARMQKLLQCFLRLSPCAERYCAMLRERRPNWRDHLRRIVALAEFYGPDPVAAALEDATEYEAWSSDYIENILQMRNRIRTDAPALHLTRREDMLDLQTPQPDLGLYSQ